MAAAKPKLSQYAKSKTVQINGVGVPALLTVADYVLPMIGITMPPIPVIAAGWGLLNILVRRITNKPLAEK